MYQTLLTEVDHGIGIVTLNRPERHNAFDETLIRELTQALRDMAAHANVRAVVLSSTGRSFCAGADLDAMRRAGAMNFNANLAAARDLAELMRTLAQLAKPTVARIQGPAYGGGVGLVACCDVAVASVDASFALTEVRLGLTPSTISPYVIAAIGERYARRYMLTAERFGASEAYRIGLVHEIVPDESALDAAVGEIVDALVKNGPQAMAACKELIRSVALHPVGPDLIEVTAQHIASIRAGDEGREGLAAFLEKREPRWIKGA